MNCTVSVCYLSRFDGSWRRVSLREGRGYGKEREACLLKGQPRVVVLSSCSPRHHTSSNQPTQHPSTLLLCITISSLLHGWKMAKDRRLTCTLPP